MLDSIELSRLYEEKLPPAEKRHFDMVAASNLRTLAMNLHQDPAMVDQRWRAYALATARTECGIDFAVRSELGPRNYFDQYEPNTTKGKRLGNLNMGDGYLYRGRGYVQITGRANYEKFAKLLNIDLLGQPELALEPATAYRIMSMGMTKGLFTGVGFQRYINDQGCDYLNARRIINGLDRAEVTAANAQLFHTILQQCEKVHIPT